MNWIELDVLKTKDELAEILPSCDLSEDLECQLAFDVNEDGTAEGETIDVVWSWYYRGFMFKNFFIDIDRVTYFYRVKK